VIISSRSLKKNMPMAIGAYAAGDSWSCFFAPYLAPYDPLKVKMSEKMEPASSRHLLGTIPGVETSSHDYLRGEVLPDHRYRLIGLSMFFGGILGVWGDSTTEAGSPASLFGLRILQWLSRQ